MTETQMQKFRIEDNIRDFVALKLIQEERASQKDIQRKIDSTN